MGFKDMEGIRQAKDSSIGRFLSTVMELRGQGLPTPEARSCCIELYLQNMIYNVAIIFTIVAFFY